ncbi:hypothetical protein [Agreia bicolorata]|uniref:hypothetical protein n=1 Tax=Agreia bicolorata TaxID=110935 RepID=UPI001269B575|nr:hypothetical protein [Agreia bicolorata]
MTIFVASPGDLKADRAEIPKIVLDWNQQHGERLSVLFLTRMWEFDLPHGGHDPRGGQNLIDSTLLLSSDACIALFWTTLGNGITNGMPSSAHELSLVRNSGRPTYVWLKQSKVSVNADVSKRQELVEYVKDMQATGYITGTFTKRSDLSSLLHRVLFDLAKDLPVPAASDPEQKGQSLSGSYFKASISRSRRVGYFSLENLSADYLDLERVSLSSAAGPSPSLANVSVPGGIAPAGVWREMIHFPAPVTDVTVKIVFQHPAFGRLEEKLEIEIRDT